jgi:hypothetical protein
VGGANTTANTPWHADWGNAMVEVSLLAARTYYFYPWWDVPQSLVRYNFGVLKTPILAAAQNADGRISLSAGGELMKAVTPAAAGSSSGNGGGGKYL